MIEFYFPNPKSRKDFKGINKTSIDPCVKEQVAKKNLYQLDVKKNDMALAIKQGLAKFVDCAGYQIAFVKIIKFREGLEQPGY